MKNSKFKEFIFKHSCFNSSNKKIFHNDNEVKLVNKLDLANKLHANLFSQLKDELLNIEMVDIYLRTNFNNWCLTSVLINETKRNDSCFISDKNQIGLSCFFYKENDIIFVKAKKIIHLNYIYESKDHPELKSSLGLGYITNEYFVESIKSIKKIVYINLDHDSNLCFYSLYNCAHLFN